MQDFAMGREVIHAMVEVDGIESSRWFILLTT